MHFYPLIEAGYLVQQHLDHNPPVSNTYTELLNNLLQVNNRVDHGYGFEVPMAMFLINDGFQKTNQTRNQCLMG